jgi:hypothetical protein
MTDHDPKTTNEMDEDSLWNVTDDSMNDPEELRVIFCAIDSYL